VKQRTII